MPWFGSPRPGQPWPQARTDQMFALAGVAMLQRQQRATISLDRAAELPAWAAPAMASAAITRVWTEYDIGQSGRKGLRLHIAFTASGLVGGTGTIAAYFFRSGGGLLRDANGWYFSASGEVCVGELFTPPYPRARYNDFPLFIPYLELHAGPGIHDLGWFVIIWGDSGQRLAQSTGDSFVLRSL